MAVLETVSLAKTTTEDGFTPFAQDDLWVVDGIFTVTTNTIAVGAVAGSGASTAFDAGVQFGVKLVNLRQVLVKPNAAGVHGTLTFWGTVVDRQGIAQLLQSKLGAT